MSDSRVHGITAAVWREWLAPLGIGLALFALIGLIVVGVLGLATAAPWLGHVALIAFAAFVLLGLAWLVGVIALEEL